MRTGTDEPDSGGSPGDRWAGPSTGGDADEAPLSGASERFGLGGPTWQAAVTRELPAGTNLGGVTILRLLAAGGMGLVYEGRQTAPHRRVAVKVIRGGLATAATLRRFEYEAEVLARLTHPNIAQIHTFGTHTTPDGPLPFFVMELVDDARPITQHAVEERLGMRQRIAMARDVCAAVAHGHGKGVIHRDLKPGNILVDAGGTPKVIDFGVARGLDADRPPTTGAGDIVGTLRYMSPEQLAGDPGGVDARSDVHALGLVLHELVTGRLPFDGLGKPAAMAAGMLGDERLPIAATVAGAVRDAVGAADAASLGVIVEKCLKRNPADRYATAAELEAELGRWLAGEPILARRPTAIEWLARWSRRHRWAAGSAVIAAAAITAAAVGITIFGVQAEREAEEARRQLYLADVLLAAESRDRGNVGEARRLLAAARGLARRGGEPPIELACLAASLDDAIGVLDGHEGAVVGVAFRPGGRGLVTADGYGFVRVVSAAGPGETMGRTDLTFRAHEVRPWGLAISPDGRFLATASGDGTTRVWRTDDGSQVRVIEAHGKTVYGVAFSPDGRTLLTCGSDRMARLWETRTWRERQTLVGHVGTVYAGCFSPDGDVVATTSQDRTVRLWDVATGTAAGTLSGHGERVFHAAFSPDGRRLVTASEDETARIWDVASLEEVDRLRHPLRVNAAVFVGDGRRVVTAAGDGLLRVWTAAATETPKVLRGHAAAISCLATAGGSVKLATGSADGTARIWDLDEPAVLRVGGRVLSAAHAPDATTLALGLDDGAIHLFDAATLRERRAIAVAAERVNGLAYSPDGESIAAACDDGTVRACNVADGECRGVFRGHGRRVYSVCYSRDGAVVATAAEDRTARLWRASSAEAIGDPLVHPRRVFCAALGPDGTTVATACEDRIVRLWRVADGREIRRFAGHTAQVNWVCFAADGERIATASSDGSVRVWTVSDGRPVRILTGPARQVWKAAFSPDGSRIVGVSADGTVQIWISDSGSATPLLRGHGDEVWALSFAPDGRSLLTGSWDGTARVWGVAPAEIARRRGGG